MLYEAFPAPMHGEPLDRWELEASRGLLVMQPEVPSMTSGEQVWRAVVVCRSPPELYQTMQLFAVPPYIPPPNEAEFPLKVQLFAVLLYIPPPRDSKAGEANESGSSAPANAAELKLKRQLFAVPLNIPPPFSAELLLKVHWFAVPLYIPPPEAAELSLKVQWLAVPAYFPPPYLAVL